MKPKYYYIIIGIVLFVAISVPMAVFIIKKRLANIMSKSNFINPTAQYYKITSPFGNRVAPKAGANTFHNGIDLATPTGTPVLAVADGTVEKIWNDTSAGGGLSVRVKHADGYTTGFAHLSEQLVKEGQAVKQGDVIAKTGNTGNSTGAHLHFTLKYGGLAIDPQEYFYK